MMLTFSAGAYQESMIEKKTRMPSKESAQSIRLFIPVERPLLSGQFRSML